MEKKEKSKIDLELKLKSSCGLIRVSPGTMFVVGDAVGHVAVWKMAEFCLSDWSQLHTAVYQHERYLWLQYGVFIPASVEKLPTFF